MKSNKYYKPEHLNDTQLRQFYASELLQECPSVYILNELQEELEKRNIKILDHMIIVRYQTGEEKETCVMISNAKGVIKEAEVVKGQKVNVFV